MSIFDRLKNNNSKITIEQLFSEKFEQQYFNECKFIWKNYVPKSGQSEVLQGELLRELEKLRNEAQDNGNINWDDDYSYFCEFIMETLCAQSIYTDQEKEKITLALNHIKKCGNYARQYSEGKIAEDKVEINRIACVADNLYDVVADAIGFMQKELPAPIPFMGNEKIKR